MMNFQLILIFLMGLAFWIYGKRLHKLTENDKSNIAEFPKILKKVFSKPFDRFGLICQIFAVWIWSRSFVSLELIDIKIWNLFAVLGMIGATILIVIISILGKWF